MLVKSALEKIIRAEAIPMEILITGAPNTFQESAYHLDVVDAEEGEPFTLESFRKSVLEALKAEKDYILAKVTTSDPNNATSLYSYYYSAFEINKVLFKYETDRHLLHRMKVRNPMNNMFIMGQVYYYKITYDALENALQEYEHPSGDSVRGCTKAFTAFPCQADSYYVDNLEPLPKKQETRTVSRDIFKPLMDTPEKKIEAEKKLRVRAIYFANDGDFLVRSQVREYFKQNTVNRDDYFIFELERTQNDFLALLESPDGSDTMGDAETWKRALTAHLSFILVIVCLLMFLGSTPFIFFIVFPLAIFFFLSMAFSLLYIFCCRRHTFGSLSVESVEEV